MYSLSAELNTGETVKGSGSLACTYTQVFLKLTPTAAVIRNENECSRTLFKVALKVFVLDASVSLAASSLTDSVGGARIGLQPFFVGRLYNAT